MTVEEPTEVRDRLRIVAATAPARARAYLPGEVAGVLISARASLPAPARPADIERVCEGYGRELWLWLAGERTWAQCEDGLVGRLTRRAVA